MCYVTLVYAEVMPSVLQWHMQRLYLSVMLYWYMQRLCLVRYDGICRGYA